MEKVGQCPRCSAPIFLPPQSEWVGGTPPLVTYTCECAKYMHEQMARQGVLPSMLVPPARGISTV